MVREQHYYEIVCRIQKITYLIKKSCLPYLLQELAPQVMKFRTFLEFINFS
jgi:hypothetical protein